MQTLTTAIMQKLEQVTGLKWIDIDMGQLDLPHPPVDYPCALIDVDNIDYTDAGESTEIGDVLIAVKIAQLCITESNHRTPTIYKLQGAEQFNLIKEVHKVLKGYDGDNFAPLRRTKLEKSKQVFPKTYTLYYTTTLYDEDTVPQYQQPTPVPKLTVAMEP